MKRRMLWIALGLSLWAVPACLPLHKYSGTDIEASRVAQIQPGETTKKQALQWFGLPMAISAPGELVTVPLASLPEKEYRVPRKPPVVASDGFFELFSSDHEIHEYHRVYYFYNAKNRRLMVLWVVFVHDRIYTKFNKLWLLVNEKTGIVEDHHFKKDY